MASATKPALLDLAPPKAWRRLIPKWVRSLIWVDSAQSYDAFLSYSWQSDREVAPVIQSVIQRFLRPWYKTRAKTVFRDLSCLPASSSLEDELFARLDRSAHLILLASPAAAESRGMDLEAQHWFSRQRDGQVLIIVTAGEANSWEAVRDHLIPAAAREHLPKEPLWSSVTSRRDDILREPNGERLHAKLVEDLNQVLLRLHPGYTWGELRGEERAQKRRAILLLSVSTLLFLVLSIAAVGFAFYARSQQTIAESRQLATQSQQAQVSDDPLTALRFAIQAGRRRETAEAFVALYSALRYPRPNLILNCAGQEFELFGFSVSPDGRRVATGCATYK